MTDDDDLLVRLAEQIGYAVMACSYLDHSIALLIRTTGSNRPDWPKSWASSGSQLAGQLISSFPEHPWASQLADSYQIVYIKRNHLVHGVWHRDPDADLDFLVGKPTRPTAATLFDDELWAAQPWDVREIRLLAEEARQLSDTVLNLLVSYAGDPSDIQDQGESDSTT